ncbi:hypothetical protein QYM36_009551 [Artemia franciscana]|uniref:CCHC-type domain-containing protein n=1 Tax=Artemia franciscana TaxID=6661 RepID=A0AA88HKT0_ARTSF|nr:hypothetical protein QYM36_009551 [Artemia franciscana]
MTRLARGGGSKASYMKLSPEAIPSSKLKPKSEGVDIVSTEEPVTPKINPAKQTKTPKSAAKQVEILKPFPDQIETPKVTPMKQVKTPKTTPKRKSATPKFTPSKHSKISSDEEEGVDITPNEQPETPKSNPTKQTKTPKSATKQVEILKPTFPDHIKTPKAMKQVKNPKTTPTKKSATPKFTPSKQSKIPSDEDEGVDITPTEQPVTPKTNPSKQTKTQKSATKNEISKPTPVDQSDIPEAAPVNQVNTSEAEANGLEEDLKPVQKARTPKKGKVPAKWGNDYNRANKKNVKFFKGSCLKCRKQGHKLVDCPDNTHKETCFKCGKQGHKYTQCPTGTSFKFATCFVCNKQGHIARECPENPRGVFPHGGKCRSCQEEGHMMVDCPKMKRKFKDENMMESKPPKKVKKEKVVKM